MDIPKVLFPMFLLLGEKSCYCQLHGSLPLKSSYCFSERNWGSQMVSSFFLVDLIFPVYSKYFLFLITAMTLATVTDSYRWNSIFLLGVIFIPISLRVFLKHSSDSRNLKNNIRCCPLWSTTDRSFPFWFSFFILDLARKLKHTIYPVARISHNRYRGILPMRTSLSFLIFVLLAHGTVPTFKDEAAPVQISSN